MQNRISRFFVLNSTGVSKSRSQNHGSSDYYHLEAEHVDPVRLKKEREKARKLRKSQWWLTQVSKGICGYCGGKFKSSELTMDHIVPIARGGKSIPGNVVPSCHPCNQEKKLHTPVERILKTLAGEHEK